MDSNKFAFAAQEDGLFECINRENKEACFMTKASLAAALKGIARVYPHAILGVA